MEEFSAGGIVYKTEHGNIVVLISQHSGHHGWVFPKGHVGDTVKNETVEEAAIREVQEETGIVGKILKKLPLTNYWYIFNGQKRHKTVRYFLMKYASGDSADHGWEMENVAWLPVSEIGQKLTYDGDKKVWEKAKKLLKQK